MMWRLVAIAMIGLTASASLVEHVQVQATGRALLAVDGQQLAAIEDGASLDATSEALPYFGRALLTGKKFGKKHGKKFDKHFKYCKKYDEKCYYKHECKYETVCHKPHFCKHYHYCKEVCKKVKKCYPKKVCKKFCVAYKHYG